MKVKVLKYWSYEVNSLKVKVSDSLDNVPNENVVTHLGTDSVTNCCNCKSGYLQLKTTNPLIQQASAAELSWYMTIIENWYWRASLITITTSTSSLKHHSLLASIYLNFPEDHFSQLEFSLTLWTYSAGPDPTHQLDIKLIAWSLENDMERYIYTLHAVS